jgi:hypothetical protein
MNRLSQEHLCAKSDGDYPPTDNRQPDAGSSELHILVLVSAKHKFNQMCGYIARGAHGGPFSVDHARSVSEAVSSLCGKRYDIAVADTRLLASPEKWDSCRGIVQSPCVLLFLTSRRYGHVVEPTKKNRAQLIVRGRANFGVLAAAIRYALRMRKTGNCGTSNGGPEKRRTVERE